MNADKKVLMHYLGTLHPVVEKRKFLFSMPPAQVSSDLFAIEYFACQARLLEDPLCCEN